jgi:hypothetical protein
MLTIPQIEALRKTNPQLYETLKRLAGASLGPNQGWSLDNQVTDGTNFARVSSAALTSNQIDPTKSGVLMRGSVPPTWSGAFTYASTTSSITWSWSGLSILRADGTSTAVPNGSLAVHRPRLRDDLLFLSLLERIGLRARMGFRRHGICCECVHREDQRRRAAAIPSGTDSALAGRHGCGHH